MEWVKLLCHIFLHSCGNIPQPQTCPCGMSCGKYMCASSWVQSTSGIFCSHKHYLLKYSQTRHSSPMRMSYGMSFVRNSIFCFHFCLSASRGDIQLPTIILDSDISKYYLCLGKTKSIWSVYKSVGHHINGLVQERRNSSALAMDLRLSCTNPSIYRTTKTPKAQLLFHFYLMG